MTPKTAAAGFDLTAPEGRAGAFDQAVMARVWTAPMRSRGCPCPRCGRRAFAALGEGGVTWREDLRALGECRDCEVPLLASERNHARYGVCRAKRAVAKGRQRGYAPASMTRVEARMQEAIQVRIEVIGYDDGADDREAVRRRRAA